MPVANCCTRFCSKDTAYLVADVLVAAMLITLGSLYLAAGDAPTFKQAILGIYAIVFGVVLLLAEMGIHVIVKTYCQFLDNLFGRGLFYVL